MDLVIINSKKEAVTSHVIISEGMKVTQDSSLKLIKTYKTELSELGLIRFEIVPLPSGQKQKQYMLNEHQAMFLITLMRNNPETVEFKVRLVKSYAEMQEWIKERIQSSVEYKVMQAILKDSRQLIGKKTKHFHYSNEANLVNWAMSGKFKSLNREKLSLDEIALLNELQARNAVLIGAGMVRDRRKESLQLIVELSRNQLLAVA